MIPLKLPLPFEKPAQRPDAESASRRHSGTHLRLPSADLSPAPSHPARSQQRRSPMLTSEGALQALYAEHRQSVYRLALRYAAGQQHWAEDVTQDVFLKALDKLPELADLDDLGGWFYRVATNQCLKRLRQDRFRRSALLRWLLPEVSGASPETGCLHREAVSLAVTAMARLSPKRQVAFCMYHLDGKSQLEIAETLGFTKGYVSKLIQQAEVELLRAGREVDSE